MCGSTGINVTGSKRDLIIAVAVIWSVVSIMAYVSLYKMQADAGVFMRIATAALVGVGGTLLAGGFFYVWHLLFDELPRAIRWLFLSPLEKYAKLVNSHTKRGYEERERLLARLVVLAESKGFRETIYYDPTTEIHWRGAHREVGHSSSVEMLPIDAQRASQLLARFGADNQS